MKTLILMFLLALTVCISACQKNADFPPLSTIESVEQSNWKITLYNDCGEDELHHFVGYSFTFSNGLVTATMNGSTINGTYSSIIDDGKPKFILNFGSILPFEELNCDWNILEETSTTIRLEDVSVVDDENDFLTFEKN
jgi:hypothetical protein